MEFAMVRSWRSFVKYFGEARAIRTVTYSQSPQIIHEAYSITKSSTSTSSKWLSAITARVSIEKICRGDVDLAAQLNHLLQNEQLQLFTLDKQVTLHSKLYLIENRDGTRTLILGSPNPLETSMGGKPDEHAGCLYNGWDFGYRHLVREVL